MCGCTASFKSIGTLATNKGCGPRPMKPRQSGRTISIRSAKQYKSFHMPTLNTSTMRRRAVVVTLPRMPSSLLISSARCQVNRHELMQRHDSHIRCECTGTRMNQCVAGADWITNCSLLSKWPDPPNHALSTLRIAIAVLSGLHDTIHTEVRGTHTSLL